MAKVTHSQSSFGSGELSPRVGGRTDLERYKTGLALCENMIVLPHGGVMRRPGFEFIHEVKDSTKYVELIPFEFSEDQAYVLEFGDLYMRVYMDGGLVVTPDAETVLLLHMDGHDGDITFTDESITPHTVTPVGSTQVDTDYYKFATGSLILDGYLDYLSIPDNADFSFSNGEFTIDCWIRIDSHAKIHTIYSQADAAGRDIIWFYYDSLNHTLVLRAVDTGAQVINLIAYCTIPINEWHHVAVSQDATNIQLYFDGIEYATQAKVTMPNHDQAVIIGCVDVSGSTCLTNFFDHGASALVITTNGDTVRNSTQARFGTNSIKFDGNGDYLSSLDNAAFDIFADANPDTMVCFWVWTTSNSEDFIAQLATVAGADNYWRIGMSATGSVNFGLRTAATYRVGINSFNTVINDGAWHHIAVIRKKPYTGIWVDGLQGAVAYYTENVTLAGPLWVGYGVVDYFTGYLDDVMIEFQSDAFDIDGFPFTRYKADPRAPITDSSHHAHGPMLNGAGLVQGQVSTVNKKWGNSAIEFDGTDDSLYYADHADWELTSQANFTVDFWVYLHTHVATSCCIQQMEGANDYWSISHTHGSGWRFIQVQGGGAIVDTGMGGEIADAVATWHHVAVCKVGNEYGIYLDGVQKVHTSDASSDTLVGNLYVGSNGTPANYVDGGIDELRIRTDNVFGAAPVVGLTDVITVPVAEYTDDANTVLLMHFNHHELYPPPGVFDIPVVPNTVRTKLLLKGCTTGFDGHIDEFRVCKGAGRWSSDFSVATSEYPGAGGGDPYELVTTYTDDDIEDLRTVQSADVLYIAHPDFNVMKLGRTDHDNWTITEIDWNQPAWNDTNTTAITLSLFGGVGSVDIHLGDTPNVVASAPYFDFNMVGTYFYFNSGFLLITAVISNVSATGLVKDALTAGTATADWKRSLWDVGQGYPSCIVFHDDRLVLAGIPDHPLTICFSQVGDYENFDVGTSLADEAIIVSIMSQQQDTIKWMLSSKRLYVGTVGGEYWVSGTTLDTPVTPTSIQSKAETRIGSEGIAPVMLGGSVLFVQDGGERIRIWSYSMQTEGWESLDLSMMAEHMTVDNSIMKIQYSQFPHSVLWATTLDGTMIGVTAIPEQKIISFHKHTTGVLDSIESIAVIPGYLDDELWVVVNRDIGGVTYRFVERMHDQFYQGAIADAFFVDSGLSYSGAPALTFYGMDHLEGETVQVLADGVYVGTAVIASGEFTLSVAASTVHAGIAYNSNIQTFPWELSGDSSSTDTAKKRIVGCLIKMYETSEFQFGRDATHLMDIPMTDGTLYTDWIYREFNGDFLRNPTVYMRQNKPLPATILSIVADIDVEGK